MNRGLASAAIDPTITIAKVAASWKALAFNRGEVAAAKLTRADCL